ncbi:hypothetical protein BJX68DRAFT_270827 [Aspergillus pseudodeflectus]|uniref:Ankyrin repeat-containing domain protein n=1 Tax=Aspergillus pseudodeflectus TaxID=176178 RepID=A0ABR4JQ02_9EURO
MSLTPLPLDIEYLILNELSHLSLYPTRDECRTILSCLCVCSRWHSTLQELLIRNNTARSLLRPLNKIGQIAVKRVAAEYVARKNHTHADPGHTEPDKRHGPRRQGVDLEVPATYSARISENGDDTVLVKDLERCARLAPRLGDLDSLRTCLEAGAPYNYNSWWMLIDGVNHNQTAIIKYILDASYGSPDPVKNRICNAKLMQLAIAKGNVEIVGIFLDRGFGARDRVDPRILVDGRYYSVSVVSYAAFHNQVGVLEVLLQRGMGVEDPGIPVRPVYWAVKHDNVDMMKVFIRHKVDFGPGESAEGEEWPLKRAVQGGSVEMVRLLLEHTRLPRSGCSLKKILRQAVQERGDDAIDQELALYGV